MKILRKFVLILATLTMGGALTGCTAFTSFSEVEALNEAQAVGSPFTQALVNEYRAYSNSELSDMFDYPDALHFARKGLAAASGEIVLPEPVSDWNLDDTDAQELSAARGRLINAFDLGARETHPERAATTQVKFDCWIEGQEENWHDSGVVACKDNFMALMSELEDDLQPRATDIVELIGNFGVDPSQPLEAENAMYLVFFDWDKNGLTSSALNVLDAVAGEVSQNPPASVNVVGHTDTSGAATYNKRLAFRRANAVKDALVERGVPADIVMVDAMGENELLVSTNDDVREPANRRVNISFN